MATVVLETVGKIGGQFFGAKASGGNPLVAEQSGKAGGSVVQRGNHPLHHLHSRLQSVHLHCGAVACLEKTWRVLPGPWPESLDPDVTSKAKPDSCWACPDRT